MFCFREKSRRKRKYNVETERIVSDESDSLLSDEVYASVEDSDELSFDDYQFDNEVTVIDEDTIIDHNNILDQSDASCGSD